MKMVFSGGRNRIVGDKVYVSEPNDFRHLKKVQRVKVGEELLFFEVEKQIRYRCKVVDFGEDEVILRVLDGVYVERRRPELFVIQALIHKGVFEDEVNRLSELGVDFLQPIISKHSQNFTFDGRYFERLRRIAYEGAKAVGNPFPVTVLKPFSVTKSFVEFERLVRGFEKGTKFLLFTSREIGGVSVNFLDVIPDLRGNERVVVCVGSEGGFTEEEEDVIASFGFVPVNLGRDILLRSDTVCIGVSFALRLMKYR